MPNQHDPIATSGSGQNIWYWFLPSNLAIPTVNSATVLFTSPSVPIGWYRVVITAYIQNNSATGGGVLWVGQGTFYGVSVNAFNGIPQAAGVSLTLDFIFQSVSGQQYFNCYVASTGSAGTVESTNWITGTYVTGYLIQAIPL